VVDFIRTHIIYRYGVPSYIITHNGKAFINNLMISLYEKFKFAQYKSSMYNAPSNGLVETFNKTLCNLLKKVVMKSKWDWHEWLEELRAYQTRYKTPTQSTPLLWCLRLKSCYHWSSKCHHPASLYRKAWRKTKIIIFA